MGIQSLTPPHDVTWTRLAYSRDMIDTNFGDFKFPTKWRSSLAVYYYMVPDEETAMAYPDSRIVYLRLTCSITGWNPNEEILGILSETAGDDPDDLQVSIWETIKNAGFASEYLPCYGAIMQIGVYPNISNPSDSISVDDYPEIMDFEPKKRELYESVTEGGEVLEESSARLSVLKGDTTIGSTQTEISAGIKLGPIGEAGGSHTRRSEHQVIDNNTTDTSRQDRETKSHTTSYSQMYQLFNGYHLGTNRAVFVVAPRPHIASNTEQVDFSLIAGDRKLEGIQDVFLVVQLPKRLSGFCVQASIDTGHKKTGISLSTVMQKAANDLGTTTGGGGGSLDPFPDTVEPGDKGSRLVVTRRMIQNCGKFDEGGNFNITRTPEMFASRPSQSKINIVWEDSLPEIVETRTVSMLVRSDQPLDSVRKAKISLVNEMNISQSVLMKSMIKGFSAGNFEPIPLKKSQIFNQEMQRSIQSIDYPISKLVQLGYLGQDEERILRRFKILTVGDIFKNNLGQSDNPDIKKLRSKILEKVGIRS